MSTAFLKPRLLTHRQNDLLANLHHILTLLMITKDNKIAVISRMLCFQINFLRLPRIFQIEFGQLGMIDGGTDTQLAPWQTRTVHPTHDNINTTTRFFSLCNLVLFIGRTVQRFLTRRCLIFLYFYTIICCSDWDEGTFTVCRAERLLGLGLNSDPESTLYNWIGTTRYMDLIKMHFARSVNQWNLNVIDKFESSWL